MPVLKLISHHLCPYVQRARIVLEEKSVSHNLTFIDLANKEAGTEPDLRETLGVAISLGDRFTKDAKEEKELLYTFLRPPILDGTAWRKRFGTPPPSTPYEDGMRATVQWWKSNVAEK